MPEGKDWLYRPVGEGMCSMESLLDGTLDYADLADMNDYLDVRDENIARDNAAAAKKK